MCLLLFFSFILLAWLFFKSIVASSLYFLVASSGVKGDFFYVYVHFADSLCLNFLFGIGCQEFKISISHLFNFFILTVGYDCIK